jgi:hypothetical protein
MRLGFLGSNIRQERRFQGPKYKAGIKVRIPGTEYQVGEETPGPKYL